MDSEKNEKTKEDEKKAEIENFSCDFQPVRFTFDIKKHPADALANITYLILIVIIPALFFLSFVIYKIILLFS